MAIVLRHRGTGEIACGMLQNVYHFAYYGALWWEDMETAEQLYEEALAGAGYEPDSGWDLLEVKEERLKVFNVKLNNDARRKLVLQNDGSLTLIKP
ncbi:hypothetical protein A8990_12252 [Paenibacillus taihuensis]|uniref:Uncharacterized protein n=1 Tax=Paenibacillus taihuensis TaxID=1156355 RepID=A0A3D9RJS5_9BACL|nr:hypothetical protein [Paenibacillus taihuensis]REE80099.1 hypothetical protein A8990_12252 [Paenibacillus taihuensis]